MLTDLPNVLTLSRIAAIPLLVALVALRTPVGDLAACVVFGAAAITDYFDGKLARDRRQTSDLGRMLDPIADKLLVGATLMMLVGMSGACAVGPVSRDRDHAARDPGQRPARVSRRHPRRVAGHAAAKWKTGFQMGALGTLLAGDTDGALLHLELGCRFRMIGEAMLWVGRAADPGDRLGLPDRRPAARAPRRRERCGSDASRVTASRMNVIGLTGWSGSGKTTLLTAMIPCAGRARADRFNGETCASRFDLDQPGKDSYRHREAGAREVLVAERRRWALMHELDGPEPSLPELLRQLSPVDVVIVEGFKINPHPKIEVYRPSSISPPIWPGRDGYRCGRERCGRRDMRQTGAPAERSGQNCGLDAAVSAKRCGSATAQP